MSSTPAHRQAAAAAGRNAGQGQAESTDADVDVNLIEIHNQVIYFILLVDQVARGGAAYPLDPLA